MGKFMGIDFGTVRCGLAITDDLKMIASPLETVPTKDIMALLVGIVIKHRVERFVIGVAHNLDGSISTTTENIEAFITKIQKKFPEIPVSRVNEMFSSKMASQSLVQGGMKKSDRQKKGNLDKVSAALILQDYLQYGES